MPGIPGTDIFGQELQPAASRSKHTETFDLAADLSDGERWAVANAMQDRAQDLDRRGFIRDAQRIRSEATRYERCGKDAVQLECPRDHEQYYVHARCRSRICERCGRIQRQELQRQIKPLIAEAQQKKRAGWGVAMLTLTVSTRRWGDRMPKPAELQRFQRETWSFMRLFFGKYKAHRSRNGRIVETRRKAHECGPREDRRIWKGAGWCGTLEFGADNNNAHGHFLIFGPIVDWLKLKTAWETITTDSSGVFIRRLHSVPRAVDYVLKYVTKPPVSENYTRIAEYAIAVKGSRRIRTGGIFWGRVRRRPRTRRALCVHCGTKLLADYRTRPLTDCGHRLNLWEEYRRVERAARAQEPLIIPERLTSTGQETSWIWAILQARA